MPRSRNIKPAFFANENLADLPPETRLLFIGLWCLADKEGRLEDRPRRIGAFLFPYESHDVEGMIDDLGGSDFLVRYEAGGVRYIQITNFTKHQSPHCKEQDSTIPAPDMHGASTGQAP